MPEVLLTFMDGEVVTAEAPLIDFHSPILRLTSVEPGDNNRDFVAPLSSVKYVVFGGEAEEPEPPPEDLRDKVVIHFVDHEIIRAYAGRDVLGGQYGIIYTLVDPDRRVRRRIGVPYTSVKAIFNVKRWDSRGREPGVTYAKVARILAERQVARDGAAPRGMPILDRARERQPR